jgi:putative tryptophan/tyrosine transport system substrate-binding protein
MAPLPAWPTTAESLRADPVIDRRTFLAGTGAVLLAAPLAAEAQPERTIRKVGVINTNSPRSSPGLNATFWARMRELGWIEGQNLVVEFRDAVGDRSRVQVESATSEMVELKVDIIVMESGTASRWAQDITRTVPICVFGADLQVAGVVASLARPGGNVTGVQAFQADLVGKRLALLKEVVPRLRRVGVLIEVRGVPTNTAVLRAAEEAGRTLGLQVQVVEVPHRDDLERGFAALTRGQAHGVLIVNNAVLTTHRNEVVALAAKSRLAAIYEYRGWVEAGGGLMSYGPVLSDGHRQLAECADKILRGAKPAELPVQQPTKLELIINLKTAKALGLTIPPSLLGRADEVIQ